MKMLLSLILLLVFFDGFSQERYLEKFSKYKEKTYTYHQLKDEESLKLNFYKPKKAKGKTPLLVYVHGGGFSGGSRNDKKSRDFAEEMVQYGYSVASISYRLTMKGKGFGCATNSSLKIAAFNEVSKDISYAVKYLIAHKNKFKIDIDNIILVGSSAGAEAILNLAYVYDNKILNKNFKFAGIIAMAGAITSIDNITSDNAIPTQLFHGVKDNLVPYYIASHHYCKLASPGYLNLFGSRAIANKLKAINKPYYLYSIKEGSHNWNSKPIYECTKEIIDFLYYDVLKRNNRQIETTF
ncbi:carboxylesterase family protein [Polaribacter sp. R2A056_3_33]|uniref:carboxylesterase family protein n=1 Tax=Polaribacter sp. R2A056_3_33 TaxID=2745563 RepID=UPI001C4EB2EA|nr:carboxylesterase family protein [Polaribacter sp. R2A056_3_33]QXP69308.1 carboxylesterase family protein [Polaribacter sp. R2A056_3_33]